MDTPPEVHSPDVSCDRKSPYADDTSSVVSCSSTDITVPPGAVSDCAHLLTTNGIPSEIVLNASNNNCKGSVPTESGNHLDIQHIISYIETTIDVQERSSNLCCGTASSVDASVVSTQLPSDSISQSVDNEVQPCAPVVVVGGASEEGLKRGLEQRLGLVLSKLARETDEDTENVDDDQDELQKQSLEIVSDHFTEDIVSDVPDAAVTDIQPSVTTLTDVQSSHSTDAGTDAQWVLAMDIVQEMEEVERYSYISLVAYAMHQLFEYSTWNRYVPYFAC